MTFSKFFINRPKFAFVISIVITLAGGLALLALPVAQFPEITPPTVRYSPRCASRIRSTQFSPTVQSASRKAT